MKKYIFLTLVLLVVLTVVGCTKNTEPVTVTDNTPEITTTAVETKPNTEILASDITETVNTDTTEYQTTSVPANQPISTNTLPNQSYVGTWYENNEYYQQISILNVDSNSNITFSSGLIRLFSFYATAIEIEGEYVFGEDISPFYSGKSGIKGKLVLEEDCVTLIYNEYPESFKSILDTHNTYKFPLKEELSANFALSILDTHLFPWSETEQFKMLNTLLENTEGDLVTLGWTDIQSLCHEPNAIKRWGVEAVHYDSTHKTPLYSIIGTSGDLSAVVRIVYDRESDTWDAVEVYYVSTSGKVLQGEALETFMTDHGKTDFILSADDADLLEYFK